MQLFSLLLYGTGTDAGVTPWYDCPKNVYLGSFRRVLRSWRMTWEVITILPFLHVKASIMGLATVCLTAWRISDGQPLDTCLLLGKMDSALLS
ncbi:hypothetical protein GGR50DRAFT_683741 [Xylaria sp. CBS 124048]|nr:hypothetical protein GGR50DRAFT_683741 [Xylaria sp. CBS 124048]